MVLELLTNPDAFFERRAENPRWRGPALVVLVVALLGALSQIPVFQLTASALPPEAQGFIRVFQAIGLVVALVFTFVIWIVYGVVLHVVATVAFDAQGDLWDLVKLAGWGFVPNILGSALSAVVSFVVFGGVTLPADGDPQALQRFITGLQSDPLFVVTSIVGVVLLLWTGLLWAFAVRNVRHVPLRTGLYTAAVPVGIGLLLQLAGLVAGGVL